MYKIEYKLTILNFLTRASLYMIEKPLKKHCLHKKLKK